MLTFKSVIRFIFLVITFSVTIALTGASQSLTQNSLDDHLESVVEANRIPILIELVQQVRQQQPGEALIYALQAEKLLEQYPDAKQKSQLRTHTGWAHFHLNDFEAALELSNEAEQLANSVSYHEGIARAKLLRGRVLRDTGKFTEAVSALESALVQAEITDISLLVAAILNESGTVYRRIGQSNRAIEFHNKALNLAIKTGDKPVLASTYNFLGINHDIIGNYEMALRFQLLSLNVQKELKNRRGMAASMTNIGTVHQKVGRYEDALQFYEQSLAIWRELELQNESATTLNNIGAVHELLGDYENALSFYEQAISIWNTLGNLFNISTALDNLGSIHMYLGDYDKAYSFKREALDNHITLGNNRGIANSKIDLALIYMRKMEPELALEAAKEGLKIAAELENWSVIRTAHETLSDIYEKMSNYEESLHHHKLYKAAHDTLFSTDSQAVIAELQEQYRTRYQQQQIELLQSEGELQRIWFIMLSGGIFLLVMVTGLMYNRHKLKDRAHKTKEQLHMIEMEKTRLYADTVEAKAKLLESENQRKTDELENARNLQLSMLPEVLPDYKYARIDARMITATEVGGDYYDIDVSDDDTLTFCIGDATGHGTKAGILVTVMKSLYNLLCKEKDIINVMHRCSETIKKMRLPNLYMVLALARLKGNNLEIVGAGMPPALIYRSNNGKVEQIELKGMPLGSVLNYPYQKNEVSLYTGDVLLLMSDGFPELSTPDGTMIGYSASAEILAEVGDCSPQVIIEHFQKKAFDWIQSDRLNDDMTFFVLKMK